MMEYPPSSESLKDPEPGEPGVPELEEDGDSDTNVFCHWRDDALKTKMPGLSHDMSFPT